MSNLSDLSNTIKDDMGARGWTLCFRVVCKAKLMGKSIKEMMASSGAETISPSISKLIDRKLMANYP